MSDMIARSPRCNGNVWPTNGLPGLPIELVKTPTIEKVIDMKVITIPWRCSGHMILAALNNRDKLLKAVEGAT
jgi:hypothetical protein